MNIAFAPVSLLKRFAIYSYYVMSCFAINSSKIIYDDVFGKMFGSRMNIVPKTNRYKKSASLLRLAKDDTHFLNVLI